MHNSFTQNNYKMDLSIMKKNFLPRKDVLGLKRFFPEFIVSFSFMST